MRILHTADLHIGKVVNEFSMLEDQKYILQQILEIAHKREVDAVIIAGDVYDRSIPPAEAVTLLDWFLESLVESKIQVFMISGNHDSPERVGFASNILDYKGLYIAGESNGIAKKVTINDSYGPIHFYLLPFMKPQIVKYYLSLGKVEKEIEDSIRTFEEGVRASLKEMEVEEEERNILITHHFVTNCGIAPEESDSEVSLSLGGVDNVEASVFDDFDYVALGHIHRPQMVKRESIRYAGSPLKYSFSEVLHKKSITIIEMKEKGDLTIENVELKPLKDMRKIKGELKELMDPKYYGQANVEDYIQATLTDDMELVDPIGTLRSVYPNVMQIILEKNLRETKGDQKNFIERKSKSTIELFDEFYTNVTSRDFDEERRQIMLDILEEAVGGGRL